MRDDCARATQITADRAQAGMSLVTYQDQLIVRIWPVIDQIGQKSIQAARIGVLGKDRYFHFVAWLRISATASRPKSPKPLTIRASGISGNSAMRRAIAAFKVGTDG